MELPAGDTLHVSPATHTFYQERAHEPAWTDEEALTQDGQKLLGVIEDAVHADRAGPRRQRGAGARRETTMMHGLTEATRIGAGGQFPPEIARIAQELMARLPNPASVGLIERAGFPEGVVNIVPAVLAVAGEIGEQVVLLGVDGRWRNDQGSHAEEANRKFSNEAGHKKPRVQS